MKLQLSLRTKDNSREGLGIICNLKEIFYADITTDSNATGPVTKDFIFSIGKYDATADIFTVFYGYTLKGQAIPVGINTTTITCQASGAGDYDCMAGIGVYNELTTKFTYDATHVKTDALHIKGIEPIDSTIEVLTAFSSPSFSSSLPFSISPKIKQASYPIYVQNGDQLHTNITFNNETNSSVIRHLFVSYGKYDQVLDRWSCPGTWYRPDLTIPLGMSTQYVASSMWDIYAGWYDMLVAHGWFMRTYPMPFYTYFEETKIIKDALYCYNWLLSGSLTKQVVSVNEPFDAEIYIQNYLDIPITQDYGIFIGHTHNNQFMTFLDAFINDITVNAYSEKTVTIPNLQMTEPGLYDIYLAAVNPACASHNNETDCVVAGCYWYDGICHFRPQSSLNKSSKMPTLYDCTLPPGWQGDYLECGCGCQNAPDALHSYRCDNGTWVDLGYNANCETGASCSSPTGDDGDWIECGSSSLPDNTHAYKCVNGTWIDMGYNSICIYNMVKWWEERECLLVI